MKLDSVDQLMIRACKTKNKDDCLKKLEWIYRRFFLPDEFRVDVVLDRIVKICDGNGLVSNSDLVRALYPGNLPLYGIKPDDKYHLKMLKFFISCVRFSHIDWIKGYKIPTRFKSFYE